MAIRKAEEIIEDLAFLDKDDTRDIYIKLLEDITDSMDDIRYSDLEDALKKAQEETESYKTKYIERFKSGKKEDEMEDIKTEEDVTKEDEIEEVSIEDIKEDWKNGKK